MKAYRPEESRDIWNGDGLGGFALFRSALRTGGTPNVKDKKQRRAIPYERIATMYQEGLDAKQIGTKLRRLAQDSADPNKPIRAILSRMRTIGYRNAEGKLVKLRNGRRAKKEEAQSPTHFLRVSVS